MAGSKTAGSFQTALNPFYADSILVDIALLIVCLVDIVLLIVCLIFVCKFGN